MVEKFAINLVDQMLENKMIVEQQKEHYIYSLILQIERIITLGTILIISYFEDNLILTVLFLIFFLTLRARTGGFHCNTFEQCYIGTTLTYALIAVLADYGVHYWKFLLAILFLAIATVVAIGTVNHPNMHMNSLELEGSKKAARMLVVLQGSVIYFCVFLKVDMMYIYYMSIAVILCAILLCLSKILKQEVNENEESEQKSLGGSGKGSKT